MADLGAYYIHLGFYEGLPGACACAASSGSGPSPTPPAPTSGSLGNVFEVIELVLHMGVDGTNPRIPTVDRIS